MDPAIAEAPYNSLVKSTGYRLRMMSLMHPPNVAVMSPLSTATSAEFCVFKATCVPMTAKVPSPMESRSTFAFFTGRMDGNILHAIRVTAEVTSARTRYSWCRIQNTGVLPRSRSRTVPPPTAVTVAMARHPTTSNPFSMAWTVPASAKAAVPK